MLKSSNNWQLRSEFPTFGRFFSRKIIHVLVQIFCFCHSFLVPNFGRERSAGSIWVQEARKFRLSHRSPVALPLETALSLDSRGFLRRHEVIVAWSMAEWAWRTGCRWFSLTLCEVENPWSIEVDVAGKIICFYGPFSSSLSHNQRVTVVSVVF